MNNCPLDCGAKYKKCFYSHFPKCLRKDLLGKDYLKCKFNYMHIVKKEDYHEHLKNCESIFFS